MHTRNPIARNAWKCNKISRIENKKLRNDRKKFRQSLKKELCYGN